MPAKWFRIGALLLLVGAVASAQTAAAPSSDDMVPELLKETQAMVHGQDYTGMIWWIPPDFWEQAFRQQTTPEKAAAQVKPLRDYVMVVVAVGKIGLVGNINFVPPDKLRSNTVLRDAAGHAYAPLTEVAPDAEVLANVMKPILTNALGKFGEAIDILFFPARNAAGQLIADPRQKGSFSIVLKEIAGRPEYTHEWLLPLTSLSPPKYCPVGKERVQANWNFCPIHGVPLNETQSKPAEAATAKPQ